ncbi:MAG: hypothetical protein FJ403_22385 [Verrucomicrobia bacterium]|nr:hypothetical protein [Verrucomicrobiota bacterium]
MPRVRVSVVKLLDELKITQCPFDHLRRRNGDTWSVGLTDSERETFAWLNPVVFARVRFLEKSKAGYLRQASFVTFTEGPDHDAAT